MIICLVSIFNNFSSIYDRIFIYERNNIMDAHLINKDININLEDYPKGLREIVLDLEKFNDEGDWLSYKALEEGLEASSKYFLMERKITQKQFNILTDRYRSL